MIHLRNKMHLPPGFGILKSQYLSQQERRIFQSTGKYSQKVCELLIIALNRLLKTGIRSKFCYLCGDQKDNLKKCAAKNCQTHFHPGKFIKYIIVKKIISRMCKEKYSGRLYIFIHEA